MKVYLKNSMDLAFDSDKSPYYLPAFISSPKGEEEGQIFAIIPGERRYDVSPACLDDIYQELLEYQECLRKKASEQAKERERSLAEGEGIIERTVFEAVITQYLIFYLAPVGNFSGFVERREALIEAHQVIKAKLDKLGGDDGEEELTEFQKAIKSAFEARLAAVQKDLAELVKGSNSDKSAKVDVTDSNDPKSRVSNLIKVKRIGSYKGRDVNLAVVHLVGVSLNRNFSEETNPVFKNTAKCIMDGEKFPAAASLQLDSAMKLVDPEYFRALLGK